MKYRKMNKILYLRLWWFLLFQPSLSTEELNQEMANLEGLMKDLNAITAKEFEC
jgi:Neogenin C-terminus